MERDGVWYQDHHEAKARLEVWATLDRMTSQKCGRPDRRATYLSPINSVRNAFCWDEFRRGIASEGVTGAIGKSKGWSKIKQDASRQSHLIDLSSHVGLRPPSSWCSSRSLRAARTLILIQPGSFHLFQHTFFTRTLKGLFCDSFAQRPNFSRADDCYTGDSAPFFLNRN